MISFGRVLRAKRAFVALSCAFLLACGGGPETADSGGEAGDGLKALADALTFHASFDQGWDGDFALGDRRVYSAPSYDAIDQRAPNYWGENIELAYDEGLIGNALRFKVKNTEALFYSADQNVAFSPEGWSGTISFWLNLDPNVDLDPGYCDPIQVTDSAYNDSAIWVDFTRDDPRKFRLGVFGELSAWNPDNVGPDENPAFNDRLVVVDAPPFASGKWTHVVITHEGLGTPAGKATLYVDGAPQGTSEGISEAFEWDPERAAIRLGVNYVGLWDELSVFNRPLTPEEIQLLGASENGAWAIHQ